MRVNSVFDELELVTKMTISSKTHKEKNQTRTNNIVRRGRGGMPTNRGVKPPTEKNRHNLQHRKQQRRCEWTPFSMISSLSPRWPKAPKLTKRRTKQEPIKMMQGCNGLSSVWTIWSSYSSRAPLDSTAIDPITRSPNYHHETGKIENLSRENLCLAHGPLELDDDDLYSLKMDHLSWLRWLDED